MIKLLIFCFSLISFAHLSAAAGTTFCPYPQDFKYDYANGQMIAPGGWSLMLGEPAKFTAFIKAQASEFDGTIEGCTYNIILENQPFQISVTADNYHYVADNIKSSVWHKGASSMICLSSTPETCTFHQQNKLK